MGITTTTLRRWELSGKLVANYRTFGNHRRYCLNDILELTNQKKKQTIKKTICYSRVSTHEQKLDLERQTKVLEKYTSENQLINTEYINDIGSGLNCLNKLIKLILNNEVDKLIITHKDRLLRFGSDLLISIAKQFDVETVILNNEIFEQELSSDVLEIITVFSAKLYGSRSHKNKKIIKTD